MPAIWPYLSQIDLSLHQRISPCPKPLGMVRNMTRFYGEELSTSHPTPKLEDHPLSTVQDCLLNIFMFLVPCIADLRVY